MVAWLRFRWRGLCYLSNFARISMRMDEHRVLHMDQEETNIPLSTSITSPTSGRSCALAAQHLSANLHKASVSLGLSGRLGRLPFMMLAWAAWAETSWNGTFPDKA